MKIQITDIDGKKAKEIDTPIFESKIRKDIIQKIFEAEKLNEMKEYSPFWRAGNQTSASGNVSHRRHVWKTDRGRGMARIPKKRMSDKGTNFSWVGAVIPGTRGGRRAHPPKIDGRMRKINQKEAIIGLKGALAMSSSIEMVSNNYQSLKDKKIKQTLPIVAESKLMTLKTKDFIASLKKILAPEFAEKAWKKKTVRAGRGKMRNRKYKENAGLLVVLGDNENAKFSGVDLVCARDLKIRDLMPNGMNPRITLFTESSIKDIGERLK